MRRRRRRRGWYLWQMRLLLMAKWAWNFWQQRRLMVVMDNGDQYGLHGGARRARRGARMKTPVDETTAAAATAWARVGPCLVRRRDEEPPEGDEACDCRSRRWASMCGDPRIACSRVLRHLEPVGKLGGKFHSSPGASFTHFAQPEPGRGGQKNEPA